MFFGIVLIIIGAILLLEQFGVVRNISFWAYIWPALIIAIGLRMILVRLKHNQGDDRA